MIEIQLPQNTWHICKSFVNYFDSHHQATWPMFSLVNATKLSFTDHLGLQNKFVNFYFINFAINFNGAGFLWNGR